MNVNWVGRRVLIPALILSVAACADDGLPTDQDFQRIADTDIRDRSEGANRTRSQAVNFFAEQPVTRLYTSETNSFRLETDMGQEVPRVPIGEINAAPLRFGALLNQIAEQAGMSWRIVGGGAQDLLNQDVYFVQRSETMLETVLEELAEITEAFYKVEGDRIIFSQDRLFVVRVPRMANSQEVLIDGLGSLGATEIFSDVLSGTVSFRANRPTFEAARRLIDSLERGRDMIVYDFWLIDRNISDRAGLGAALDIDGFGGLSDDIEEGGLTFGGNNIVSNLAGDGADGGFVSGNLGDIGLEATLDFLRALGETETVARPTISMLSGDESSFSSGESSEYIRSVNSSTEEGTTSSGTEVESLETGVDIDIEGAYNAGVISTSFEIAVSELIAFEEFDTGDVTLRLPRTAERDITAHLEARPGDVMVLGGIIREREDVDATEVTGTGVTTQRGKEAQKTETIILVRPRLVQIRPGRGMTGPGATEIEPGINEVPDVPAPLDGPGTGAATGSGTGSGSGMEDGAGDSGRAPNPITGVIEEEQRARSLLDRLKD